MKNLLSIGLIFIFIGFILILLASSQGQKGNVKTVGGIFLGPIPLFGFGNDKTLLYIMFGLGILLFIISEVLRRV